MKPEIYQQYPILAAVFRYPDYRLEGHVRKCEQMLAVQYPEALEDFRKFADWVHDTDLDEMEEVYTKTFHIQAICYLDLGYVIFGEDYKRGEFLVNMKREQAEAHNDCGDELPDNLINILTLMPKIREQAFRDELAVRVVIPALGKMLEEFKAARMELKTKVLRKKHKAILQENQKNGNIYQYALRALLEVFKKDFEGIHYEDPKETLMEASNGIAAPGCSCSFIHTKTTKTVQS